MAKIERATQKIFAGSGESDNIAAFGSFVSGTPVYTDNIEALQTTAYTQGWSAALAANEAPFQEEMNGVQYGFSKQLAYLLETGVPEWDDGTTYYANTSFCQIDGVIYQSLTDDNIGNNPTNDTTNWRLYFRPSMFITTRDYDYAEPDFVQADKSSILIKADTAILQKNNEFFYTNEDVSYNIADVLDTGSVSNGKDYYFYMNNNGELVASLNESAPEGYTVDNVMPIGGAHTLCVDVGDNAPTPLEGDLFTVHPAAGYMANDFIPNSSWTPAFCSMAYTGNKGQALVNWGAFKFWCDIYLMSNTGEETASSYANTITNNRQYQSMFNDLMCVGKYAPNRVEFMLAAMGSNQQTNIAGSTIPSHRLCGGYLDTAGNRMISYWFLECMCGYLWQIGRDIAPTGGSSWGPYAITGRGQHFGTPYVLKLGGIYDGVADCGSWSLVTNSTLTTAQVTDGARGLSLHKEIR